MRRLATMGGFAVLALVGLALTTIPDDTPEGVSDRPAAVPPTPPQPYRVPARAVRVRTVAELALAVRARRPRDIVLEDGVYTRNAHLTVVAPHRLWARTLGGATLRFGLVLGNGSGRGGHELHGLRIDVRDPRLAFQASAVHVPGTVRRSAALYDTWVLGNRVLAAGIKVHQTNALRIKRVVVKEFTDWGIVFHAYHPAYLSDAPAVTPVVTDADISSVHRPVRGASDGTGEAGLWAGAACFCARIRVRDTGWSGLETTGNTNGAVFQDLDIGDVHGTVPAGGPGLAGAPAGVGIYVEHYTRRTVFRRVHVHAGGGVTPRVGLHAEWADPAYAGTNREDPFVGAAFDITVEDSVFDTSHDGIYLADATRSVIRRNRFEGQRHAGVRDYMSPGLGHTTTLSSNTFALKAGALAYTRAHSGSIPDYLR